MTQVLVVGASVAAVECVLALRELAGSRVALELLAPAELLHRPSSVTTPFGGAPAARIAAHRSTCGPSSARADGASIACSQPRGPPHPRRCGGRPARSPAGT